MAYRPHGRAKVNPALGPWKCCDRCGLWYSSSDLVFQYDFRGGSVPQNTGWLVCTRTCLDALNYNNMLLIIPPDPPPQFDLRPEAFDVDSTNWLTTQDGDIIDTQSGENLITSIPDPSSNANTVYLACEVNASGGSVSVMYLDLFNGDPTNGGYSVLRAITGSATRTDVASELTLIAGTGSDAAENTDVITVTSASASTSNVNYIGFYSSASGGTLRMSGRIITFDHGGSGIVGGGIVAGSAVQFNAPYLRILNATA